MPMNVTKRVISRYEPSAITASMPATPTMLAASPQGPTLRTSPSSREVAFMTGTVA